MGKERILCISNDPISKDNANGKFIRLYLDAFPDNSIYSFFISEKYHFDYDSHFFNVTDSDLLNYLKKRGEHSKRSNNYSNAKNKTPLKYLARYFLWRIIRWERKGFYEWISNFNPTSIVCIMGSNPYLLRLAVELSKKYSLPLYLFIGEDYPLKKYDFISKKTKMSLSYKMFKKLLVKYAKKIMLQSNDIVYNSQALKNEYESLFKIKKGIVIYPLSDFSAPIQEKHNKIKIILYAGNLRIGRSSELVKIAKHIKQENIGIDFLVCGSGEKDDIDLIKSCDAIKYLGLLNNEEMLKIMKDADLLIHVEANTEYNSVNTRFAFSTKIADFVVSQIPFFVYCPPNTLIEDYLRKYYPERVATSEPELYSKLNLLFCDNSLRINAECISNHTKATNSEVIYKIIKRGEK